MKNFIFVKDREGSQHKIEAEIGMSLMEIIRDYGLDIEAACGGCCACATCHVYVEKEWLDKLSKIDDEEESMLDQTFNLKDSSRLSCQLEFKEEYSGIKLELAPE